MGKLAAVVAVLVALMALAVASEDAPPRADLTYIELVDMNTLDPQRMSYNQDMRLSHALYEGLVRWDVHSPDFRPVPGAASRWTISDDRLVYTFHLDPLARWSNADPVRASDFVYSWKRALLPDSAADYSKLLMSIRGAREFFAHRVAQLKQYAALPAEQRTQQAAQDLRRASDEAFDQMVGLRALDERTLQVTLTRPVPYFLDLCGFSTFMPVHPPSVEKFVSVDAASGMIRQQHGWTKPPLLVSNGPFMLTRWAFKRELRLERNPHYRAASRVRAGSVALKVIEDANTSVLAFKSGAADLHMDLDVEYILDLLDQVDAGVRDDVHRAQAFGTYFWSFNCTPRLGDGRANPFHDAKVRRAFALAVDKQALVTTARRSREQPARTLIPPGSIADYESPAGLPFDPERARAELASAGWVDRDNDGVPENDAGEDFPTVELLCTPTGSHRDAALAMGLMFERTLGVRTTIDTKETKVYRQSLRTRDYMMARGGWFGDYLDPLTFLDIHRTGDGNNDRGFSDPAYDALLAKADAEPDPALRLQLLQEAERYTVEEAMPVLPIHYYDHYYMFRPPTKADGSPYPGGLRGVSTHPRHVQAFDLLEVVR